MPEASPPCSGATPPMAAMVAGMNTSAMPTAEISEPGSTSVVRQAIREIAELWEPAEPLVRYFAREIMPLMPQVR